MISFALAVFFLIITPGPGVLSTAGVGAAFGYRPGLSYVTGLCIGNFLVGLAVVTGLAALILSNPQIRTILLFASAAYLCYLAFKIAFSGNRLAFIESKTAPGLVNGLMLQAINPKAYAVSTALFSGFAFMPGNFISETIIKFLILNAIWIPIHLAWLGAGVMVERLDLPDKVQFAINMIMALSMLAVVALALMA
ncbi:MAG: LysE family translocator [Rhizobiales bacterium]|nr:LysE family translocator [Hyphomicrobiales bacterium]